MCQLICDDAWAIIIEYTRECGIRYTCKYFFECFLKKYQKEEDRFPDDMYTAKAVVERIGFHDALARLKKYYYGGQLLCAFADLYPEYTRNNFHKIKATREKTNYHALCILLHKEESLLCGIIQYIVQYTSPCNAAKLARTIGQEKFIKAVNERGVNEIKDKKTLALIIYEAWTDYSKIAIAIKDNYLFILYLTYVGDLIEINDEINKRILIDCKSLNLKGKRSIVYGGFYKYAAAAFGIDWLLNNYHRFPPETLNTFIAAIPKECLLLPKIKEMTLEDRYSDVKFRVIEHMAHTGNIDEDYLVDSRMYYKILCLHPLLASKKVYSTIFNTRPYTYYDAYNGAPLIGDDYYSNYMKYEDCMRIILEYDIEIKIVQFFSLFGVDKYTKIRRELIHEAYMKKYYPTPKSLYTLTIVIMGENDKKIIRNMYYHALKNAEQEDSLELAIECKKKRIYF